MLVALGICHAIGLGVKVKSIECPTPDEEFAIIGRIASVILIAAAGIYLIC
jgi:hypothetical protein